MNTAANRTSLQIDDYLDMLSLAVKLGDEKWQREIKTRIQYMVCRESN